MLNHQCNFSTAPPIVQLEGGISFGNMRLPMHKHPGNRRYGMELQACDVPYPHSCHVAANIDGLRYEATYPRGVHLLLLVSGLHEVAVNEEHCDELVALLPPS
ncbi:hypothetical protein BAUCODRAFT_406342 [Baudoinia panamericana UAMH 10762]|uniref:Uncharacterized protein n=1 Tax=Baudoinia panamericana (strain UAMH 10762) TaxID=717646 RepID=M2LTK7_BAUPA|nr:uncharacterized protein BAUCODRAFT_406342 [Baudoinia panamericana UAMH 10762]EMC97872.1 hypothetical protein BAUCODRAFT_406342 [Baudoinia panamericana UAMH 10762]